MCLQSTMSGDKEEEEEEEKRKEEEEMASADSGAKPLQHAMKMAKVAIQLDGENKHQEAYCEYLRTINYISQALLEEAGSQVYILFYPMNRVQLSSVLKHCL